VPQEQRGDTRFELAQVIADTDPARAKELVNEAIAAYREAGAKGARGLAAAQAWIEARG